MKITTAGPSVPALGEEALRRRSCAYTAAAADIPGDDPLSSLFAEIDPVADSAMTYFYGHLVAIQPQIGPMFPPAMDDQRRRFYRALCYIAANRGNAGELAAYLAALGRGHRKFGVQEDHFDAVRRALAATWRRYAPRAWTADTAAAWDDLFTEAAAQMTRAAERDAETTPAWWLAEIVWHEVRGGDLAVLTLLPSQPLHHLPGQHISVQVPRWPRLWRDYSIANAPHADGTLTLHVRAVPGGLVSAALVHHVTAGDTLLLGAPAGTMTVDLASPRDVLCLAGGTGLAPVKAVIEAVIAGAGDDVAAGTASETGTAAGTGRRREIVLYVGARRARGLYDWADLRRMAAGYPGLHIIPVLSDEAAPHLAHGTIPQMVAGASWEGRDIYIGGPDEMTERTVTALKSRGAPGDLIHYDAAQF